MEGEKNHEIDAPSCANQNLVLRNRVEMDIHPTTAKTKRNTAKK
jgi:hypothetical protein